MVKVPVPIWVFLQTIRQPPSPLPAGPLRCLEGKAISCQLDRFRIVRTFICLD